MSFPTYLISFIFYDTYMYHNYIIFFYLIATKNDFTYTNWKYVVLMLMLVFQQTVSSIRISLTTINFDRCTGRMVFQYYSFYWNNFLKPLLLLRVYLCAFWSKQKLSIIKTVCTILFLATFLDVLVFSFQRIVTL